MSARLTGPVPSRTAALTVARSRRDSGVSVITALWIWAGMVRSLSSGFCAHSHHRSNASLLFVMKRVLHPAYRQMLSVRPLDASCALPRSIYSTQDAARLAQGVGTNLAVRSLDRHVSRSSRRPL